MGDSRNEITRDISSKTIIGHSLPRDILDDDDIGKILQFPQYAQDADVPASHFWVPLIALYTGARLDEICRLDVDDFSLLDGIMCFDINIKDDYTIRKG